MHISKKEISQWHFNPNLWQNANKPTENKELNIHFSKEEIQTAHRYINRYIKGLTITNYQGITSQIQTP
jgi:predicted RNA-binding protein with PIN domain